MTAGFNRGQGLPSQSRPIQLRLEQRSPGLYCTDE